MMNLMETIKEKIKIIYDGIDPESEIAEARRTGLLAGCEMLFAARGGKSFSDCVDIVRKHSKTITIESIVSAYRSQSKRPDVDLQIQEYMKNPPNSVSTS